MRVLVKLDGTLLDPDQPALHADDLGLMRGDGVFETILVTGGTPRELGPHLDRLARSAQLLDLPEPDRAAWERCVRTVLENWTGEDEFALKLVYTRGTEFGDRTPTGFALAMPVSERLIRLRETGVSAVSLERGIDPELVTRAPWLLLGSKSLSYAMNMAAIREAERRGAQEAIFLANDGSVLEGPTASVVVAEGDTLRTPPPNTGILAGTTQAALFRAAEKAGWATKVEPIRLAELRAAAGVFLASAVRKITRVHTLDGEPLSDSRALHAELARLNDSEYR
jgi:4-amino-4-deoxychorismate lyase